MKPRRSRATMAAVALALAGLHCGDGGDEIAQVQAPQAGAAGAGAAGAAGGAGGGQGGAGAAGGGAGGSGQGGGGAGGDEPGGASGTGGAGGALKLPQFIRGAAFASKLSYDEIPLVVEGKAGAVKVTVDGAEIEAAPKGEGWVGKVPLAGLAAGDHTVSAEAEGWEGASGVLRVEAESVRLTDFDKDGGASTGVFHHDREHDQLVATWVDRRLGGDAHAYMALLDGAGRRLRSDDVRLDAPPDSAIRAYTALGEGTVGVLYQTLKGSTFGVHLRVVDLDGADAVEPLDLTGDEGSYIGAAIAWDGEGYSAIWQHVTQPDFVTELRWLRVDAKTGEKLGPKVIAREDDKAENGKAKGLVHLGLYSLACRADTCAAAYPRQLYNALVDLDQSKIFTATISTKDGTIGENGPFYGPQWDLQEDPRIVADKEGFALTFVGSTLEVDPQDPCDEALIRYLLYAGRLGLDGKPSGKPVTVIDAPGSRFQPLLLPLAGGFAASWEDQRSQCEAGGTNRLAFHALDASFKPTDPYSEVPKTRLIGHVWPTAAAAGPNVTLGWMNDLKGSILDPRPELWFDTRWRE